MAIWFDGFPLDYAEERGRDTLIAHLGIEMVEAGDDYLVARMPVDQRTRQPAGVLHGGASPASSGRQARWPMSGIAGTRLPAEETGETILGAPYV